MSIVADVADCPSYAKDEPTDHPEDRLLVERVPGARIEFRSHPNITEQPINHPGHPSKEWSLEEKLSQVSQNAGHDHERQKHANPGESLDQAAQVFNPKQIEADMQQTEMEEDGRE